MKILKFKKIVEIEGKIEGSYSNNKKINSEEDYVDDDHNNINFWQKPLNSWFDTYNEVSRNTARITEHGQSSFGILGRPQQKMKSILAIREKR